MTAETATTERDDTPAPQSVGGRAPKGAIPGLLLAASWAIPLLTHIVKLDVVLLPALVLATASLLTIGNTWLDRLIPATGLLAGLAVVAGIGFSVWPWGLHPVAVAGTSFSLLTCYGWWAWRRDGRLPGLPRRFLGSDLILVAAAAYGGWIAVRPSLRGTPTAGLGYTTLTGDRVRHFTLFDSIHRTGGYPFLTWSESKSVTDPIMGRGYPPGMHFLYALVDTFATSHTDPGNPVAELNRYRWYVGLGFAFLVLATTWAARWVLGPAGSGWRRALVCAAVGAWSATGVLTTMLWCTWDPEVLGLALLTLAAAVFARPVRRTGEQLLLGGALVVAVGFAYSLYIPFVWALAAAFAAVYRRRLARAWKAALATALICLPLSALPYALGVEFGDVRTSEGLLTPGFAIATPRTTLLILAVLCCAGLFGATGRRRPTARALALMLAVTAAGLIAFAVYQLDKLGYTTYYFHKAMHVAVVLGLMGAGTAVLLVKARPQSARTGPRWRSTWLPGTAAAVSGVILVGGAGLGPLSFRYDDMYPGPDTTWSQVWADGRQIFPVHGAALAYLSSHHLLGDGRPSLVLWDGTGTENRDMTLILAALNHDAGVMAPVIYGQNGLDGLTKVERPAQPGAPLAPKTESNLAALTRVIEKSRAPLRVVLSDPVIAERLRSLAAERPDLRLTVLFLPELPGERSPS